MIFMARRKIFFLSGVKKLALERNEDSRDGLFLKRSGSSLCSQKETSRIKNWGWDIKGALVDEFSCPCWLSIGVSLWDFQKIVDEDVGIHGYSEDKKLDFLF